MSEVSAIGYHVVVHITQTKERNNPSRRQVVVPANQFTMNRLGTRFVPKQSTEMETGSATPIAYAS